MSVETKSKLAVALHYDKTGAPRVVAKRAIGRGPSTLLALPDLEVLCNAV